MKKSLFLFCVLFTTISNAQVSVGSNSSDTNLYVTKIKDTEFDYLKNAKTYFVVPKALDFEKTKSIISSIWTFNPIEFIHHDDYNEDDYMVAKNTIIRFNDDVHTQNVMKSSGAKTVGIWRVFEFEMISYPSVRVNKKGKKDPEIFKAAEVFFTQSIRHKYESFKGFSHYNPKKLKGFEDEPDYYNFDYGYIKNYFQTLNDKLSKKEMLDVRKGIENIDKIKTLKTQTLYVPDWILKTASAFTAAPKEIRDPEEIFGKYEYPYQMISAKELNDKILRGEKFYYFMHSQFNEYKNVSIIDSETGEIIFLVENKGYSIDKGDIKDIIKRIEK